MERPTKITVIKKDDGYDIMCMDEMSGSSIGIDLPINGYRALSEHFRTGAMEISSDELGGLNIHVVMAMLPTDEVIEANGYEGGLRDNELQMYWEGATWLREHLRKLLLPKDN